MEIAKTACPFPCKDCITLSICRGYVIQCLPPEPIEAEKDQVFLIISLAILKGLRLKCSLMEEYMKAYLDQEGNTIDSYSILATIILLTIVKL